ncbi:hypothetical protein JY651_17515 [Pyxidicoccus parkwayensis]|uniref:Uncharacterized protein n=1 Tax=Pyxidicoccus parkwayensis TaxID=2813578 RepID=A0ABX7P832_9BACT|nr:hypothetical protein [Pyxidicoccus parkwaysis]QSQ26617.1 hypothetical protein JY651_17515 [Pyxidicoccus parkwaysis]
MAQAIVSARAAQPFGSVASVVAVNGVAEVRLQQLFTAAKTGGYVGATCSGNPSPESGQRERGPQRRQ